MLLYTCTSRSADTEASERSGAFLFHIKILKEHSFAETEAQKETEKASEKAGAFSVMRGGYSMGAKPLFLRIAKQIWLFLKQKGQRGGY